MTASAATGFNSRRYAVSWRTSSDVRELLRYGVARSFMRLPSLTSSGSVIHLVRFVSLSSIRPAPRVSRVAKCVRLGAGMTTVSSKLSRNADRRPASLARSFRALGPCHVLVEWQLLQFWANRVWPAMASALTNSTGGLRIESSQSWNCSGSSALTRNRILACASPQNSAHWPKKTPTSSARIANWRTSPGMMSTFPASFGTQKLCITSSEFKVKLTHWPTGMRISFAVTTSSPGYSISHHHW